MIAFLLLFHAASTVAQLAERATVVEHENGSVEEILRWGEYTVQVFHYNRDELADVAQIRDARDRVRFEVRAFRLVLPEDTAALQDYNGDSIPDLRIMGWSGGAYCCYTEYLFDRSTGLRNILIYYGREYNFDKGIEGEVNHPLQDSKSSGPPRLVVENDAIQYANGSTHGPTTVLVLEWTGSKYVDATRRYPEVPRIRARWYRDQIRLDPDGRLTTLDRHTFDLSAGYLANSMLAGDEREARVWLEQHGGKSMADWLKSAGSRISSLLARTDCRIGQSQARVLRSSFNRVPGSRCSDRKRSP